MELNVENSLSQERTFLHDSVENVLTNATRMDQSEKEEVQKAFCASLDATLLDPRISQERILIFKRR